MNLSSVIIPDSNLRITETKIENFEEVINEQVEIQSEGIQNNDYRRIHDSAQARNLIISHGQLCDID